MKASREGRYTHEYKWGTAFKSIRDDNTVFETIPTGKVTPEFKEILI